MALPPSLSCRQGASATPLERIQSTEMLGSGSELGTEEHSTLL